jgi:hypothetical protein
VFKGTVKTSSFDAPCLILAFQCKKPMAIGAKAPFPRFYRTGAGVVCRLQLRSERPRGDLTL